MLSGIIVLPKLLLSVKRKEWVGVFPCISCNVMYTERYGFWTIFLGSWIQIKSFWGFTYNKVLFSLLGPGSGIGYFFIIYLSGRVFQLCSEVVNFPHFPWNRLRVSGHILHTLTQIFQELSTNPFGFLYCVINLSSDDNNSLSVVKVFLKKWIHTVS